MSPPAEVYFFGTGLIDLLYPRAGLAGMQLLRHAGVKVIFPDNQTCCGQPAFNSGYRVEARAVARQLARCFPRDIPIVVPSGSCAGMIKHHWPELFVGDDDAARYQAIANRVFELTEFLVTQLDLKLQDLGTPTRVAIHTSCSARREMGVADHIETLVGQLNQVEIVRQARHAECCGFGGSFAVKQADISGAMVRDKTSSLRASGAERVISQDCGCLMNIGGAFDKQQAENEDAAPAVQHVAEFLLERSHEPD